MTAVADGPAGETARPWLTLVGIGEDGLEGLIHAARRALAQAILVVGGRRHLALAGPVAAETLLWRSPIEDTFPGLLARRPGPVCVLASGDPFMFGIGATLARHVPAVEMTCFPQPSAFSLAASRLGWALADCALVSLCGRPLETLLPSLRDGARVMALSADADTPAEVAALLRARGFGRSRLTVCEAMGGPRERLRTTLAAGFDLTDVKRLNTLCMAVEGPDSPRAARSLVPGRPDDLFEHDGQITKADIRAVTLARLAPAAGEVLWDIGAGSGSVAIEWMLAHAANRAFAVERRADRAARIRRNGLAFGLSNLAVVEGAAPGICAGLPRPDAVFVGGGGAGEDVVERALEALRPGGRLVVNAVTIETQTVLFDLYRRLGGHLGTLATAHAGAVGAFHGWRPAMPVSQWTLVKP